MIRRIVGVIYAAVFLYVCFLIYAGLFTRILEGSGIILPIIILWVFSAYVLLPRAHRLFSRMYLPNYFIGRTRTGDGLLGDPVNLAVIGSKKQLIEVMEKSGWAMAEELNLNSGLKMIKSVVFKKSYPSAPVSSLFLFNERQDIAFQKEVNNNPHERHHVRFWKTPKNWWMPGGHKANWLGAATYDRKVGFSKFTLQFTHKISENTDGERNFVISSLTKHNPKIKVETIKHFTSVYYGRNGGGDSIYTDGALPFITLK